MEAKASVKKKGRGYVRAAYLYHLLELAKRWGVSGSKLLAGTGVSSNLAASPDKRVDLRHSYILTRRLLALSGRAELGMEFGLAVKPTSHGFLGYAFMSSATLGKAILLLNKYRSLYLGQFSPLVSEMSQHVTISISEQNNFGILRQIFFESFLVMVCRNVSLLTGESLQDWEVMVDWPEPDYFEQYRHLLPSWKFNQPYNRIVFPSAFLMKPLLFADPVAVRHALEQLEREAREAEMTDSPNIVPRVRVRLRPDVNGAYPSLRQMAAQLHLSERTLKRRLQTSGTTYKALLNDERKRRAFVLLSDEGRNVQDVAYMLGYSDPAAFTRAFRKWTGKPPSAFRHSG